MASSWYKQFQNELNSATASSASRASNVTGPRPSLEGFVPGSLSSKQPNGVGDHLLDWGGRVLDVASRPGYAVGGFLNTILEGIAKGDGPDMGEAFGDAGRGFMGKEKEFFKPVSILDPYQEGESGLETGARWVGDFLASIATDPLTYVPFGAAAKIPGVAKLGEKIAHGVKPMNALKEGVLHTPEELKQITAKAGDYTDQGALFDVPKTNPAAPVVGADTNKVVNHPSSNQPSLPGFEDTISNQPDTFLGRLLADSSIKHEIAGPLDNTAAREVATNWNGKLTKPKEVTKHDFSAGMSLLHQMTFDKLSKVRGLLYGKEDIVNPWSEIEKTIPGPPAPARPAPRTFPEIPEPRFKNIKKPEPTTQTVKDGEGFSVASSAHRNAMKRAIYGTGEVGTLAKSKKNPGSLYHNNKGSVFFMGKKYTEDDFIAYLDGNPAMYQAFTAGAKVGILNAAGDTMEHIPLSDYSQILKGGENFWQNEKLAKYGDKGIYKGEDLVPLTEYAGSRATKWAEKAKGTEKEVTVPPKPSEIAQYETAMTAREAKVKAYQDAVAAQQVEKAAYESAVKAADDAALFPTLGERTVKKKIGPTTKARIAAWEKAHKDKLRPEDYKALRRMMNFAKARPEAAEKGFATTQAKILEQQAKLAFDTVDALEEAVKSGRVTKEAAQEVYASLGVKTAKAFNNRLEAILGKAKEHYPANPAAVYADPGLTHPFNEIDAVRLGENPRPIPAPPIPFGRGVFEGWSNPKANPVVRQEVADKVVKETVTPEIATGLDAGDRMALMHAMQQHIKGSWDRLKYTALSPRGVAKKNPETGMANRWGEFNHKKQYFAFKEIIGHVNKLAEAKGIKNNKEGLAAFKYDKGMAMLKAHDDMLRAYGIHPVTAIGGGGVPISLYDVLQALPRKHVEAHFFNTGRQVTVEQYLKIADNASLVDLAKRAEVSGPDGALRSFAVGMDDYQSVTKDMLSKNLPDAIKGDSKRSSAFEYAAKQGEAARQAELKKTGKTHEFDPANPPDNFAKDAYIRQHHKTDQIMTGSLGPLMTEDFVTTIQAKIAYNTKRAGEQADAFVKTATDAQVAEFHAAVMAAQTNEQVFNIIEHARHGAKTRIIEAAPIVPGAGAVEEVMAGAKVATMNPSTEIAAKEAAGMEAATTQNGRVQAAMKAGEAAEDQVRNIVPEADLSEIPALTMIARMAHHMAPHLSEGNIRQLLLSGENVSKATAAHYSKGLSVLERSIGKEQFIRIFNSVRTGATVLPEEKGMVDEMVKLTSAIFGETDGLLKRFGIQPAHLNSNLRRFKVDKHFELRGNTTDETLRSWRQWGEVKDPADLMSRYHAAVQHSIAEKTFGAELSRKFGVAKYPGPGSDYVRITASSGGSRIIHHIDTSRYYPREIADNMRMLDKTLKELAKPGTDNKFLQGLDSATHHLKTGLTVYRPGHHMRNTYGDAWLSYMADGVWNPMYYKLAGRIMSTRKGHYKDFRMDTELTGQGTKALSLKIGGESKDLSESDVYRLFFRHGGLPDYNTIEDLGVGSKNYDSVAGMDKGVSLKRPLGGKAHDAVAGISEYRDHYMRMAHFVHIMDHAKSIPVKRLSGETMEAARNRALDEFAQEATAKVRKWHPDGSDLTRFEKNTMRRGFLFYSWIRKAIPLVGESMFTRPGRFVAFPKAMYTLAEANGIDLNGFTDPFPADQLFPQWMGGNQGPVFGDANSGYIGMKMGVPMMDILDQYFANPGETFQTVMGATHPGIRMPYELVTGTTTQGVPIKDTGKYLLGQVPFGSLVNTMLGKPVGGVSPSDVGYDPGAFRDPKMLALINTLTGLGFQDMSKPSLIKSAEFDVKYGKMEAN